jgi:hypothetical protein
MSSYRIARRAFMRGVGAGAVGLKVMLRNLEASAQGMTSPPRFLMTHWPVGTQKYWYVPVQVGTNPNPALPTLPTQAPNGTNWDFSRILKPFGDAGLKNDMIVLHGLNNNVPESFGGGHEAGTPLASTGARTPGTRANGGETDDAVAGGPSWDQIFLKLVPSLNKGLGYVNAICDARVDSQETSTQCLSYSHLTESIGAAQGGTNRMVTQNIPLLPELRPLQLYNKLIGSFQTGGPGPVGQAFNRLKARKSVLDHSTVQLARLKTLAPAGEASKIDAHAQAIRRVEEQLRMMIDSMSMPQPPGTCAPPMMPDMALVGQSSKVNRDYKNPGSGPTTSSVDDSTLHANIGKAHMAIIRTAFQCDVLRVATFQWSPGTNHVSFKGLYPGDPNGIYMYHPTSHQIVNTSYSTTSPSGATATEQTILGFLANAQTWYNARMAEMFAEWKATTDVYGNNLLAHTVIPYITEVAEPYHSRSNQPAMIFGGTALGMKGGQWMALNNRKHNDLWLTIAQAYFKTTNPISMIPAANADGTMNTFDRSGVSPIAGLWAPP